MFLGCYYNSSECFQENLEQFLRVALEMSPNFSRRFLPDMHRRILTVFLPVIHIEPFRISSRFFFCNSSMILSKNSYKFFFHYLFKGFILIFFRCFCSYNNRKSIWNYTSNYFRDLVGRATTLPRICIYWLDFLKKYWYIYWCIQNSAIEEIQYFHEKFMKEPPKKFSKFPIEIMRTFLKEFLF